MYTDGSKDINTTEFAAASKNKTCKKYFPKEVSIFTVETCSTELALNIDSTSNSKRILIHSDLLSVISSIKNLQVDKYLIIKLKNIMNSMSNAEIMMFLGSLSYVEIHGNQKTDSIANPVLDLVPTKTSKYHTMI